MFRMINLLVIGVQKFFIRSFCGKILPQIVNLLIQSFQIGRAFLMPKRRGLRKWHPECDSCQDRWSWRKAPEHRIFCGECRQEVPAGDCRCFFQCEHQCFNDGRDVQVLCAYRQCAGVLGRGSVRSYLPCSSSWINWTAWIEFQKGEVAHDITLVSVI